MKNVACMIVVFFAAHAATAERADRNERADRDAAPAVNATTRPTHEAELTSLLDALKASTPNPPPTARRVEYDDAGDVVAILLTGKFVNDENVRLVAELPSLRRLWLNCAGADLSPEALAALAQSPRLESLKLNYALPVITVAHGRAISRLRSLQTLYIAYSKLEPHALEPLQKLEHLSTLSVIGCKDFTDEAAADVTPIPNLARLDLRYTGVTKACLPTLARIAKLERLDLSGTEVTAIDVKAAGMRDAIQVKGVPRGAE